MNKPSNVNSCSYLEKLAKKFNSKSKPQESNPNDKTKLPKILDKSFYHELPKELITSSKLEKEKEALLLQIKRKRDEMTKFVLEIKNLITEETSEDEKELLICKLNLKKAEFKVQEKESQNKIKKLNEKAIESVNQEFTKQETSLTSSKWGKTKIDEKLYLNSENNFYPSTNSTLVEKPAIIVNRAKISKAKMKQINNEFISYKTSLPTDLVIQTDKKVVIKEKPRENQEDGIDDGEKEFWYTFDQTKNKNFK